MKLEMVFRIYRRLLRRSRDYCETVIVERVDPKDIYSNPTEVKAKFVPPVKRELSSTEKSILKHFCAYHKLAYTFNEKGEMIWSQPKIKVGKNKNGKTSSQ